MGARRRNADPAQPGLRQRLAGLAEAIVMADHRARRIIGEDAGELGSPVHRIAGHGYRTELPRGQHGDDEMGDILQDDADPAAALDALLGQPDRQRVAQAIEGRIVDRTVEIADSLGLGRPRHAVAKIGEDIAVARRHLGRDPAAILLQPAMPHLVPPIFPRSIPAARDMINMSRGGQLPIGIAGAFMRNWYFPGQPSSPKEDREMEGRQG